MASVLFSTVGQAVGGPLGAGVGLAVGSGVDAALLKSGGQGARDGFAQGSAYGEVIPRLFGLNRVAGQLIWALPPQKASSRKGSGRRAITGSFAVALSSGPIKEVRRIWADGSLFRDHSGQFQQPTVMRVHAGTGNTPDPLVTAFEGSGATPSFQSLAYVVFEEFDLEPYGNRIPSLSFEVQADEGKPDDWLKWLAGEVGVEARGGQRAVNALGFAAFRTSFADDLDAVARMADAKHSVVDGASIFQGFGREFRIGFEEFLAWGEGKGDGAKRWTSERPETVAMSYLDSARDYQLGLQQCQKSRSGKSIEISWPVSCSAATALELSNRLLRSVEAAADQISLQLPLRWLEVSVGDILEIGELGRWRVRQRELRGFTIRIDAERIAVFAEERVFVADPGRIVPALLEPLVPTRLLTLEPPVPPFGSGSAMLIAGSGDAGWRGADVRVLYAGEETSLGLVTSNRARGRLVEELLPGPETIWDESNVLRVEVEHGDFLSRTPLEVLNGAGLLLVGDELLQFRDVTAEGGNILRLSGLLRRRYATGYRQLPASIGTEVLLIGRELPSLSVSADDVGRALTLLAVGHGDPIGGSEFETVVAGCGVAPLAPVQVKFARLEGGQITCNWIERSRACWHWGGEQHGRSSNFWWVFRGDDGLNVRLLVADTALKLSESEQLAHFGRAIGAGLMAVEAAGDGPVELRQTAWVRI